MWILCLSEYSFEVFVDSRLLHRSGALIEFKQLPLAQKQTTVTQCWVRKYPVLKTKQHGTKTEVFQGDQPEKIKSYPRTDIKMLPMLMFAFLGWYMGRNRPITGTMIFWAIEEPKNVAKSVHHTWYFRILSLFSVLGALYCFKLIKYQAIRHFLLLASSCYQYIIVMIWMGAITTHERKRPCRGENSNFQFITILRFYNKKGYISR